MGQNSLIPGMGSILSNFRIQINEEKPHDRLFLV